VGIRGPKKLALKACTECRVVLPRSEFYRRSNGQIVATCVDCSRFQARHRDRAKTAIYKRTHRAKHAQAISVSAREYRGRADVKTHRNAMLRVRKLNDPAFAIEAALRRSLADKVRKTRAGKVASTLDALGCSIPEFMSYIGEMFLPGMTWQTWGRGDERWHLDHRLPVASFNLTDPAQQRKCFHFSNFQPLWSRDNLRKGARIIEGMCGV
jgi:hypothetical protein